MAFKTIQTFVDGSEASDGQFESAIAVARKCNAHLSVAAIGYEPDIPTYAFADGAASVVADLIKEAQTRAGELAKATSARIDGAGIRGDASPMTATHAGLATAFGEATQYADLVTLGPIYGAETERTSLAALSAALFDANVPVLICPKPATDKPFETVVVAWNDDRAGLRAVRDAMPFLTAAKSVEVTMIDPGASDFDPAEALAIYLSRHDVHVTTSTPPRAGGSVAEALGRRVLEVGADLLVMGAYSHSRLREYVLGGVTRDVLHNPPCAVLMAHA